MTPLRRRIAERLVEAQHSAAILTTFNEVDMTEVMSLRSRFQEAFTARHGIKLGGVDWEKLGPAFGADATVVEREPALADALSAAVKSGRTTLIAARIDAAGYVDQFNALREL